MSLPPLQPGKKKCLKCGEKFNSIDIRTNWICPDCTKDNAKEYIPRKTKSNVCTGDYGVGVPIEPQE